MLAISRPVGMTLDELKFLVLPQPQPMTIFRVASALHRDTVLVSAYAFLTTYLIFSPPGVT